MKAQLLTALSIAGVLGTSTAALAANTEIFSGPETNIGDATDVLLPGSDATDAPDGAVPAPGSTASPSAAASARSANSTDPNTVSQVTGERGVGEGYTHDNPAPVDPAVNPPAGDITPPHGTTGGSGARVEPTNPHEDNDGQGEDENEGNHGQGHQENEDDD